MWAAGRAMLFRSGREALGHGRGPVAGARSRRPVCDFRGRSDQLLNGGQAVAGNLKIVDALQKAIVQTGYANAFNA